jgi:hypothetical protein
VDASAEFLPVIVSALLSIHPSADPTAVAKAATEQSDRLIDDATPGIMALRSELDRLADEVVGMSRD